MADFATLVMRADTSGLVRGRKALEETTRAGAMTEKAVGRVDKATAGLGASMRTMAVQVAAFAGASMSIRKVFGAAEDYANMQNKLLSLGASHEQAAGQIKALTDIANSTRAPLEATANLYTRMSVGAQGLGASQGDLLKFTENVGLALAASGTSASQASGALTQLSQAMSGGVVRAEEFNSMIEGAPGLLIAVANGIEGVNGDLGALRNMMLDGELTSKQFFEAMLSQSEALATSFDRTAPTISQAFTVMNNAFTTFIGTSDQSLGVTTSVANAILLLADNMEIALPVFGAVGVAIAAVAAPISLTLVAVGALAFGVITHWDEIKAAFMAGVDYVKTIPDKFEASMFEVAFAIARGIDGMVNSLSDGVEYIKDFGADVVAALKDMGRDALAAAQQIGADIVAGIKIGISQKWNDLKGYVGNLGTDMIAKIKGVFESNSPSKVMIRLGDDIVEGLIIGIDDNTHRAVTQAEVFGEAVGEGVRSGLDPVLATIFEGISTGNIKGIGNNILSMGKSSFSDLLKGAFGSGGKGIAGVFNGLKSGITGIGTALSKGVGLFGKLGGAISAAMPVIGAVSAALSFFKTTTTELNAGLRVTTDGLSAMVDTFKTLEKVKFWGLSKKISTTYEMAAADIASPIQSAITSIGETVLGLSDTLGLASDNLANASFEFEVSTKGKSDAEIQEAIAAEMTRLGNSFADAVIGSYTEFLPDEAEIARLDKQIAATFNIGGRGGEDAGAMQRAALEQQKIAAETAIEVVHLNGALSELQREGEGSLAMLERIVGNLNSVNEALYLFDLNALEVSVSGATAATALVDLSGGLEAFSTNTQFAFANMLTDTAQEMRLTEIASEKLNGTLGALGLTVPETHAEFMAMLNGQDLMTEGGRNTHAALLDVAQAFVQVNGTAQAAADALANQAAAAQAARATEVSNASAILSARADAANAAMADADAMLRAAFAAERQRLSGSQSSSIDTSSISARVGLFNTIRDALERAYTDRRVLTALGQKMRLTDATAFLRSAVSSGGTSDVDRLEAALDAVADPSTALFKSFADYQHDYNVNTNLIERLKGLTDDSLSVEEKTLNSLESQSSILQSNNASQLAALDAQMNALLGIDNSVLSLGDAIAGFQSAKGAVSKAVDVAAPASTQFAAGSFGAKLDAIYMAELGRGVKQAGLDFYGGHYVNGLSLEDIQRDIMGSAEAAQYAATGIPAFASGGYHGGGVRLVGENGPELEVTGPSRIYSAPQTRNMMNSGNDNRDVVAALNETNARLRSLQKEVNSMARISRDQNVNGTPGTRTGAVVATQEVV